MLQHPLLHGAHAVVCSATRFLAGHSDTLGGVVLSDDTELVATRRLTFAAMPRRSSKPRPPSSGFSRDFLRAPD
jgi:cystathionine beta-lyase/cystathionine gamma-synthase